MITTLFNADWIRMRCRQGQTNNTKQTNKKAPFGRLVTGNQRSRCSSFLLLRTATQGVRESERLLVDGHSLLRHT